MVGRLAKWLRILGYDTFYLKDLDEEKTARLLDSGRIVVTRNSRLRDHFKNKKNLIFIFHDNYEDQIAQLAAMGLIRRNRNSLRRCTKCNSLLDEIDRDKALNQVPDYVYNTQSKFYSCPSCKRIYWPGTHIRRMNRILESVPEQN